MITGTHTAPRADGESSATRLYDLVAAGAVTRSGAPALLAPGRPAMTYEQLLLQIEEATSQLRSAGIAGHDRVAIVLPNGPEMASAFLAVASVAVAAPLNPGYRAAEFDFYLEDLDAKAVLVQADADNPVVDVAARRGIPLFRVLVDPEGEAGSFRLVADGRTKHGDPTRRVAPQLQDSRSSDVALVLHTSGTTSRPKIVPLTHANLCASARHIVASLSLTPDDLCLNIMPLFHIHGLAAATLASLAAGAAVACSPGFVVTKFFDWMGELRPTWYTAVPTMHQAILGRADNYRSTLAGGRLRFVRSSSSALAPHVGQELERVFGVPVIEAYGMTEAAHQMCSNPLPPEPRKFGTVGRAAGPQVAIMDEQGNLLDCGQVGEVVIRGPNVTPGYENNPRANAEAFTNGWFRTGDQGCFDEDGYLHLTGRIKELINRGGEKISPREIDEVLLEHAGIKQAVAFAIPDARLGEDVAAAVVLAGDAALTESEIRTHVAGRLADFKVPRRIVILDDIPKGSTGKLQRIGLAEKLGLTGADAAATASVEHVAPRNAIEASVAAIWSDVLKIEGIGVHDNFFQIGGDSLLAVQVLARVRQVFAAELEMLVFFESPTIAGMAAALESGGRSAADNMAGDELNLSQWVAELEGMSDEQVEAALATEAERSAGAEVRAKPVLP